MKNVKRYFKILRCKTTLFIRPLGFYTIETVSVYATNNLEIFFKLNLENLALSDCLPFRVKGS